ncbi:MAG: hypothetical protein HZB61_00105 [Nitrospirae bacterium]|nr:hypothetical protein [Nitrospirota bacterium]
MKRSIFMLSLLIAVCFCIASLPHYAIAVHEEAPVHGEPAIKEEVPFDTPVEEIAKYLAPMNELNIFPCADCHDASWETNSQKRELGPPHDETPGKFLNHDSENRWCLDCHSAKSRNMFQLLNGKLVEFKEYYKVCEQCHKRIYREWKMGVHGKRTGMWNGDKQWMHCTQCHNPHNPPFQPIKPMPAPRKPLSVRLTDTTESVAAESKAAH